MQIWNKSILRLLPLPSCFSRVRLGVTPWTAAYQASPMGFSTQEYWSVLPLPSHSGWLLLLLLLSRFSHVWLCDPIDGSPSGSPVPGTVQARTLEWVAISFSNSQIRNILIKFILFTLKESDQHGNSNRWEGIKNNINMWITVKDHFSLFL